MKPYSSLLSADYYGFGCTEDKHQAYCGGPYDMPATYKEMTQTNLYNYLVNTLGLSPNDITETSSQ